MISKSKPTKETTGFKTQGIKTSRSAPDILEEYSKPLRVSDIRQNLNEQLKCLDTRLESHLAMLVELQDFYKRRAEVEMDYSKALDRLVKQIMIRHKRELWPGYSTYTAWQTLLSSTKRQSKDHAVLGDLYNNQMSSRFTELMEDVQRMYKKCRDIGMESHEDIVKVLNELEKAMKRYHANHGESKVAEGKLRLVEGQKQKVEQHASKGTLSRKLKSIEKQTEKKQVKFQENKLKALKARNEYLLCIDVANAAIKKYYTEDVQDVIDCMDCGYHDTLQRTMKMHCSAEENIIRSKQACHDLMNKCIINMNQRSDKQYFLELNNTAFNLPKKFEFQAHKGDEICQISAQKPVQEELVERYQNLSQRLGDIKLQNDEIWKTVEAAEESFVTMVTTKDWDVSAKFQVEENIPPKSPIEFQKIRSDRIEREAFYIEKFRDYLFSKDLMARLDAKFSSIQKALGEGNWSGQQGTRPPSLPPKPKKRRLGQGNKAPEAKLFGGSIEEYVEATNEDIPLIVRSCVRVISMYGMHHQGVFRVSGSQHEINDMKNAFEKGEDPLDGVTDGKDINSIAGVLKLYFRELREPLFPLYMFDEFIACSRLGIDDSQACVERLKELMSNRPRSVLIVMRYLFAFLSHLSEYSDENMMDPYNLGICFGPTLLPIPPDRDQVQYQNYVNDLIKTVVCHHEDVFSNVDSGVVYEKSIIDDWDDVDTTDNVSEDEDGLDAQSEEESDIIEAVAQYDFSGRTDRELSFKKNDTLIVYSRVSTDWWKGSYRGKDGLIPDKYITVKKSVVVPDDERKSTSSGEDDKNRSTESLPRKKTGAPNLSTQEEEGGGGKSASQPNIAISSVPPKVGSLPLPSRSSYPLSGSSSSASSEMTSSMYSSTASTGSSPSISSKDGGLGLGLLGGTSTPDSTSHVVDSYFLDDDRLDKSPEDLGLGDLEHDINSALEEIMSGVKSLELQSKDDKDSSSTSSGGGGGGGMPPKFPVGNLKETPDLVLDLPVGNDAKEQPSPKSTHSGSSVKSGGTTSSTDSDSPTLSTAELFANNNQCTMKKGSSMPRGATPPGTAKMGDVKRSFSTAGTASSRGKYTKAQPTTAVEIEPEETIWETQKPSSMIVRRTPPPRNVSTFAPRQTPSPQPPSGLSDRSAGSERLLGPRAHSPSPGPVGLGPTPVPTAIPHPAPRLTPVSARKDLDKPTPPEKPEKPKPPPKSMKPPLMKKPAKSPEVPRKINSGDDTHVSQSKC